jgi:NAD-dependent deacetylase
MTSLYRRVMVITGAGISAESDLPTFRGPDGYWRNLDPTKLATKAAFRADPDLVWEWYRERRALIHRAQPNPAHRALVRLGLNTPEYLLLTQNIDGLHVRAEWEHHRLEPGSIVQIHGDIFQTRCSDCDFYRREAPEDSHGVPHCPRCGAHLRPGVVWFDETLPPGAVRQVASFLSKGPCMLVVVVGTTASFDYIVEWATAAKGQVGRMVEINPAESAISPMADEVVRKPAAIALPALVDEWILHGTVRSRRVF